MILAKGKIAKKPYELSYLGQNIYSIEELVLCHLPQYLRHKRGIFSDLSSKNGEGRTGIKS